MIIGSQPNQQKIVYIEASNLKPSEICAFLFVEEEINSFDCHGFNFDKSMFKLNQCLSINTLNWKVYGIIENSIASIFDVKSHAELEMLLKSIRDTYKDDFFDFQIERPEYKTVINNNRIVPLIKNYIINYDLNALSEILGKVPNDLSVTIVPFENDSSNFIYVYNNTEHRVIRRIKLNANGEIDKIQTLQCPEAINNPELQLLDYRYNPDGGYTLYEFEKGYFDFISKYGFEITIQTENLQKN